MRIPEYTEIQIPKAPRAMTKGLALKEILGEQAVGYLARNISLVYTDFQMHEFYRIATTGLDGLALMDRGRQMAAALFKTLPNNYQEAIRILMASLPPPNPDSEEFGLAPLFYLPYSFFIAQHGLSHQYNGGYDPFNLSMEAQYQLTKRSSAEFSIRPFLIEQQDRTLEQLSFWLDDASNHVRRLCSEGTRPRLPWGVRIPSFINNPAPIIPILETLKNDSSLYVRRSVANSLGDIAKDHPTLVFDTCFRWLESADKELKWVIRHGVRYHAKKNHPVALQLRKEAKG
ncbi:MAG: DNA alkylation repair protein [Magnetococcales bacterium]|nr:DNA alkylation repair protein [Magnetococcales bacterium]